VLSSSVDREGKPYVAQVEAKELPIYGNQFHPEKVQFVHSRSDPDIPRGPHAIALSRHDMPVLTELCLCLCLGLSVAGVRRYLAQFFVSEARKSNHTAASPNPS